MTVQNSNFSIQTKSISTSFIIKYESFKTVVYFLHILVLNWKFIFPEMFSSENSFNDWLCKYEKKTESILKNIYSILMKRIRIINNL